MNENEMNAPETPLAWNAVGDRLRAAREARRMSLTEVSLAIRISPRVLELVESNAWEQMPGHTFARGVVRSYAKLVQVDGDLLLKALDNAPLPKLPALTMPASTNASLPLADEAHGRDRATLLVAILLVVGAAAAYFLIPEGLLSPPAQSPKAAPAVAKKPPPPAAPAAPAIDPALTASPVAAVPATPGQAEASAAGVVKEKGDSVAVAPSAAEAPRAKGEATKKTAVAPEAGKSPPVSVAPAAPAAASPGAAPREGAAPASSLTPPAAEAPRKAARIAAGAMLVLRIGETSWVEVTDKDGVMLLSGNIDSGSDRYINGAEPLSISLGNAAGVTLFYRGKPVDLKPHTRQNVARLTLE